MPVVIGASGGWTAGLVLGILVGVVAAAIVVATVMLAVRISGQARAAVAGPRHRNRLAGAIRPGARSRRAAPASAGRC